MAEETQDATRPDPNEKLVRVFDTEQESEALVVSGLLESAGIEAITAAIDFPQDVMPVGGNIIRVRAEDADRARGIIDEYRRSPSDIAREEAEASEGSSAEG